MTCLLQTRTPVKNSRPFVERTWLGLPTGLWLLLGSAKGRTGLDFGELGDMNARLHAVLKYLYAIFLLASGLKHLYNVYVADPTIMATGYPEPEATAFVLAMLETKFLLPFICTVKLIAGICILLPGREQLGVLMAFPYALGMLMWGVFMVPSHLLIMSLIFALNAGLVWVNWSHYRGLLKA